MSGFLSDFLKSIDSPSVQAILVLAAYVIAAKIVDLIISSIVRRITKFTRTDIDNRLVALLHRPVFYTFLLLGFVHSVKVLRPPESVVFYVNGFLYSMLILIWALCIVRISSEIISFGLQKRSDSTGLGREISPLFVNLWKVVVFIAGLMMILSVWKVSVTPLMASAGIAGAAVAFAAKDTIANFFGGISIFMDRPYKIGDYIVLDMGERGEVVEIGIRSTRIKTRDDILISIPNSIIANGKIINESAPVPNFRVRIPIGVAYGSDIDQVERILMKIASDNEHIIESPEPRVRLRQFGESSLNFELLCWAKEPGIKGLAMHEINMAAYNAFRDSGISIPFPHRTVYLREEKDWNS